MVNLFKTLVLLNLSFATKAKADECSRYLSFVSSNYENSHYAIDPELLNEQQLRLILNELTPPEDLEWFEKLLENPQLASFISRQNPNFFNDGLRIFTLWLSKTEFPNLYIQALFKSELWSQIGVQDKTSFAVLLITSLDSNFRFANEVLRFFSTLVNIPNYTFMTSLWFTAFEQNQKQLLDYFISLSHLNLNQTNPSGESVIDKLKERETK